VANRQPGATPGSYPQWKSFGEKGVGGTTPTMGDTSMSLAAMQPKKSAFAYAGPETPSRTGPEATSMHGPPAPAHSPSAPGATGVSFAGFACSVLSTPVAWSSRFAQDLQVQQQAQQQARGKGKSAFKSAMVASYRDEDLPAASPAAVLCATQSSLASSRMASSSPCGGCGKSPFLCLPKDGRNPSPAPSHGPSSSRALVGGQTCESSLNFSGSNQRSNLNLNLNLSPYPGSLPTVTAGGLLGLDLSRLLPSKSALLYGGIPGPGAVRHAQTLKRTLYISYHMVHVLGH
jgi:hypothetical protein